MTAIWTAEHYSEHIRDPEMSALESKSPKLLIQKINK